MSLSFCPSVGDYILETKPKEITEAQRLNYEQVRPVQLMQNTGILLNRHVFLLTCVQL